MKQVYIMAAAVFCMTACNSNDSSKEQEAVQEVKPGAAPVTPSGPPAKVSGVFKGMLPCANCTGTEAILTIKEDTYSFTKLYRGMKIKGANIASSSGNCVFDSGIVKLLVKTKVEEMFRIVSRDSIRMLDSTGKPLKGKTDYVMVRSAGQ
jgi:copper homeostasis protein (lipoprotein)